MITGASATSHIRIIPERADAKSPYCWKGGPVSGKQPVSWQLTSGSGEQTFHEAAFRLNGRNKLLTLLSYSYCTTGIPKPASVI